MGIEPTRPLFRGLAGFEARGSVAANNDEDTTYDNPSSLVGRMVGQHPAESAPAPPSLEVVRETVSACDDLPDHIRAAIIALLQTVKLAGTGET